MSMKATWWSYPQERSSPGNTPNTYEKNQQHYSYYTTKSTIVYALFCILLVSVTRVNAFLFIHPYDKFQSFKVTQSRDILRQCPVGIKSSRSRCQQSTIVSAPTTNEMEEEISTLKNAVTTNSAPSRSIPFSDRVKFLKDSVDIIDVVESYRLDRFQRQQSGRAIAVCPFHDDHNPSLTIDSTRQSYKCFACGEGGDVFRFVQEYSKLPGQKEFVSFGDVIRYISSKFGGGTIDFGTAQSYGWSSLEEQKQLKYKKERLVAANAIAASFYSECLIQPASGGARSLLRSRGLASAPTIHSFGLGYAPDVYYGGNRGYVSDWGEGSLVNYLRDSNFTAAEILESGLAVQVKKYQNGDTANVNLDYTHLMDRFRGRLIIPIFDRSGMKVIGFGGRHVPLPDSELRVDVKSSDYNIPKYLNSPESVVFEKRKVLFGQHIAQKAIRDYKSSSDSTLSNPVLLIVEGYLDAISLWSAGIKCVVASMGTALSLEQLDEAAQTAGTRGGRIVLCFDSDAAGVAAVRRLCSNGMLSATMSKHIVDISIGRLPEGRKDPADFIESRLIAGAAIAEAADQFQKEVVEVAIEWTDWYIQYVVGEYNKNAIKGATGSFSDIFERVADFLATSLRPADRTKRAFEVAGMLAELMARERNSTEVSSVVRIQLESDLIDTASRISYAREAIHRRVEHASGFSEREASSVVLAMARGYGPNSSDQDTKLSLNVRLKGRLDDGPSIIGNSAKLAYSPKHFLASKSRPKRNQKPYRARMQRRKEAESFIPHFSGFQFANKSDSDWLGLNKKERGMRFQTGLVLGHRPQARIDRIDTLNYSFRESLVYFNSADFNGHQFLSDDALNAGYSSRRIKPDRSIVEKGIASLVECDIPSMIVNAEDVFLRILVRCNPARTTVKNMLDARSAVNSEADLAWSCPAKQWLFEQLTRNSYGIPFDTISHPSKLRSYLADLPDTPLGAFTEVTADSCNFHEAILPVLETSQNTTVIEIGHQTTYGTPNISLQIQADAGGFSGLKTSGLLDLYFLEDSDTNGSPNGINRFDNTGDLVVQEILVNLLWASTAMKTSLLREELSSLEKHQTEQSLCMAKNHIGNDPNNVTAVVIESSLHQALDLNSRQLPDVLAEYRDSIRKLLILKESAQRMTRRLMDQSSSDGAEGHLSLSLQTDLASRLDDQVREVCQANILPVSWLDHDESYEESLERMAEEWGDWFDDEYVWSPNDASECSFPDLDEDVEETESPEEALQHIDREWAGWFD